MRLARQLFGAGDPAGGVEPDAHRGSLAAPGTTPEALDRVDLALTVLTRAYGQVHPDIGTALSGRADVLRSLGRYEEALASAEEQHRQYEQCYGPSHLSTGGALAKIGMILTDMRRYGEARQNLLKGLEVTEKCRQDKLAPT